MRGGTTIRALGTALLTLAVTGCGGDDAPSPAPTPERATAAAPAPEHDPGLAYVDAFGNLRGSGEWELGFELPKGAEWQAEGPLGAVVYVPATEERLVRFYRSRGHQIIQTLGGWRIEHTERTLREREDAPREASVRLDPRSGRGWTLRFDDGAPVAVEEPPLLKLIEAERREAQEDDEAPPPSPGTDDEEAAAPAARKTAPPDRDATVRQLRRRALERKVDTRRARDVSDRIYEYAKEHPERGFLD